MATTNVILKAGDSINVTAEAATIPLPNKLPLVNIGLDQTIKLPVSEITLTGTVSDSDGRIVSYKWEKMVGGIANILTPTTVSTRVTGLTVGTYIFKLTVTDDRGGPAADDKIITVLAADPIVVPPTNKYLSLPITGVLDISGQSNKIIENLRLENTSAASLKVWNCSNIIIRNCFFNKSAKEAIDILGSNNITIINCLFNGVETCVYALNSQTIKVNNNQFVNVRRRYIDGVSRGQFVQFNSCGGAGNEINDNIGENFAGESDPEDLINMYASSGTSASPLSIRRNMFRGGGPSSSGGGIMSGDHEGSYQIVEANTLLDPGQYGVACAGGYNIQLLNNKIYARQQAFTNIAMYVWAQSGAGGNSIIVKGNRTNWTNRDGVINNAWNAGNIPNTVFESPTTISLAEMGVPAHLITFVTPEELLKIRGK